MKNNHAELQAAFIRGMHGVNAVTKSAPQSMLDFGHAVSLMVLPPEWFKVDFKGNPKGNLIDPQLCVFRKMKTQS